MNHDNAYVLVTRLFFITAKMISRPINQIDSNSLNILKELRMNVILVDDSIS